MGLFSKIKAGLKKTKEAFVYKVEKLFTGGALDDDFYDELESILISGDVGAEATEEILDRLRDYVDKNHIRTTDKVRDGLKEILADMLNEYEAPQLEYPLIITIVGVNGVGKTTAVGKLAHRFVQAKKSVTIAAADTFRAAAADQLSVWADRAKVRIVKHAEGADPGAVVYDAIASAKAKNTDILLVDTAGRLHNKKNLMDELSKIGRIIDREYPEAMRLNFIVLDATTGQNAISQVEVFDEACEIDGIILTKLDGTAKGGVVIGIVKQLNVPVVYIGVGEGIDDLMDFDSKQFVEALF